MYGKYSSCEYVLVFGFGFLEKGSTSHTVRLVTPKMDRSHCVKTRLFVRERKKTKARLPTMNCDIYLPFFWFSSSLGDKILGSKTRAPESAGRKGEPANG